MLAVLQKRSLGREKVKASSNGVPSTNHIVHSWMTFDCIIRLQIFSLFCTATFPSQSTHSHWRRWPPTLVQYLAWLRDHWRPLQWPGKLCTRHLHLSSAPPPRHPISTRPVYGMPHPRAHRRRDSGYRHRRDSMRARGRWTRGAITFF